MILKLLKLIISISRKLLSFIGGILFRICEIFSQIFPASAWGCKIRGLLYKPFLKKCGKNFQVAIGAKLEFLNNIEIGDNVYIGHGSWISGGGGGIIMEDEVMLGPYVTMISGNHALKSNSYRYASAENNLPIIIKRGSWLSSQTIVTYGTIVGEATLVAAGAVVTKDTNRLSVVVGVPAKEINSFANSK